MEPAVLREGTAEVGVAVEVTPTGARLALRAPSGAAIALDALELEGLTRLPFSPFPPLGSAGSSISRGGEDGGREVGGAEAEGFEVVRNEFAMVGVRLAAEGEIRELVVRNIGTGAEVRLRPSQLERLARLHHRDLAPLVDPSDLVPEAEPDPDQV